MFPSTPSTLGSTVSQPISKRLIQLRWVSSLSTPRKFIKSYFSLRLYPKIHQLAKLVHVIDTLHTQNTLISTVLSVLIHSHAMLAMLLLHYWLVHLDLEDFQRSSLTNSNGVTLPSMMSINWRLIETRSTIIFQRFTCDALTEAYVLHFPDHGAHGRR